MSVSRTKALQDRAIFIDKIRIFFKGNGVLEVETPILNSTDIAHPDINLFQTIYTNNRDLKPLFLQSSPESAMKRLVAEGVGPIFQIAKVFRNSEQGKYHNPEFSLLEWYRPGWSCKELLNEIEQLLIFMLGINELERVTYKELFFSKVGVDPFNTSDNEIRGVASKYNISLADIEYGDKREIVSLIFEKVIEEDLGLNKPIAVCDYPPWDSCLAKISAGDEPVADRFEVYYKGVELGNGYYEETDADYLFLQLEKDRCRRKEKYGIDTPMDTKLMTAVKNGFPRCSGVAIGLDRMIMICYDLPRIADAISFDIDSV